MHDSNDTPEFAPGTFRSAPLMGRILTILALLLALAACSDPSGKATPDPDPDPVSIAEYEVPGSQVEQVTSVTGQIDGYQAASPAAASLDAASPERPSLSPAAVSTSFVGLFGSTSCVINGDTSECTYTPGRPWIPAPIDTEGRFTIALPASPTLDERGGALNVCGAPLDVAMNGLIVAHDGALGDVGVEPLAQYGRMLLEADSEVRPGTGMFLDPSVYVAYGYASSTRDASCVETLEPEGPDSTAVTVDVDIQVRPGWNVMTWVTRTESGDLTVYLRTGEPDLSVPWVELEEATP